MSAELLLTLRLMWVCVGRLFPYVEMFKWLSYGHGKETTDTLFFSLLPFLDLLSRANFDMWNAKFVLYTGFL